ncbi:MAG: hypothetical protein U5L03_03000 [Burkholderiaceae bacterium]|nr:hypothetical protein [Burkholderiaceae bacterium]
MIKFARLSPQRVAPPCVTRLGTDTDLPALRFVDPLMRADRDRMHLIQSSIEKRLCWLAADNDEVLGFAVSSLGNSGAAARDGHEVPRSGR